MPDRKYNRGVILATPNIAHLHWGSLIQRLTLRDLCVITFYWTVKGFFHPQTANVLVN